MATTGYTRATGPFVVTYIFSSQYKIWWTSCYYTKCHVYVNFEHYQYMLHIYSSVFFVLTSVTLKSKSLRWDWHKMSWKEWEMCRKIKSLKLERRDCLRELSP